MEADRCWVLAQLDDGLDADRRLIGACPRIRH